ncbi:MAG: CHAD domain-containing protein, partial [Acetobacteraceae bacterium]|nr:CHAD domain-containing protein [Acetobacteraceae bacterium]
RYAAEFFTPLFPSRSMKRLGRRLTALQDRLGHLNDGAVASGLLGEIGQANGFAGGAVRGFVAAQGGDVRDRMLRGWRRLHRFDPDWK